MTAPRTQAPTTVGSRWRRAGHEWEVAALCPPHSDRNETPWWFVLVARAGEAPHPFDWWPETSFLRVFEPVDGG